MLDVHFATDDAYVNPAGFAMMEAVIVLAHALRVLRFDTLPGTGFPQADARITLRPQTVPLLVEGRAG